MCDEVEKAMRDGALGLSSSLQYVPDMYNSTDEIVAMAKVAAKHGGVYFIHQRSEGNRSTLPWTKSSGSPGRRASRRTSGTSKRPTSATGGDAGHPRASEGARAEGLDVAANQYPWTAARKRSTRASRRGCARAARQALARLRPRPRERRRRDARDSDQWENQYLGSGGPSRVLVTTVLDAGPKRFEGKTIEQIAASAKKDPVTPSWTSSSPTRRTPTASFIASEDDVKAAIQDPGRVLHRFRRGGPDGIFSQEKSHPRGWASTARILSKYVRDEKALPLNTAVAKMTSRSAARAHLWDRGILRPGMAADVVAVDLGNRRELDVRRPGALFVGLSVRRGQRRARR